MGLRVGNPWLRFWPEQTAEEIGALPLTNTPVVSSIPFWLTYEDSNMRKLKQSTARTVITKPLRSSTDHFTPVTGLAATMVVTFSKNGAAYGASALASSVVDMGGGVYALPLSATDTNTLGDLAVRITGTGIDQYDEPLGEVVAYDQNDAVRFGLSALPNAAASAAGGLPTAGTGTNQIALAGGRAKADVSYWDGTAVAAPNTAGVPEVRTASIAPDAVTASALAADAVTEIQTGLATSAAQTSLASSITTLQADTDDIQSRLPAALVGGRIDANVGTVSANAITAAAIATDAIDADAIATTAVTELQAGLATAATQTSLASSIAAIQADTDDIQARLPAALVSGRMDVSVGAVAANAIGAGAIADGTIDRATFSQDALDVLGAVRRNTATAGAATSITLDAAAPATANIYNGLLIRIVGGTGVGQTRRIRAYSAARVATITPNWTTNPDATSVFELYADAGTIEDNGITTTSMAASSLTATAIAANAFTSAKFAAASLARAAFAQDTLDLFGELRRNTTQAGSTSTTVVLDAAASAVTDFYVGDMIHMVLGTSLGQSRQITAYNGTTKVATVSSAWSVTPATGDTFVIRYDVKDASVAEIQSGLATAANQTTILGRLPAALVGGRMDSSVGAMAADTMTASALAADAVTEIQSGLATAAAQTTLATAVGNVQADTDNIQTRLPAALVGGRMDASVGAAAAGSINRAAFAQDALDLFREFRRNTAQAGAVGSITLDGAASATDDFYNSNLLVVVGGTGAGQARTISDYVGATKVATIAPNWTVVPDNTSVFMIFGSTSAAAGGSGPTAAEIADAVWDEAQVDHQTAGSMGESIGASTVTPSEIADAVWDEVLSGHVGAGSASAIVTDTQGRLPAALVGGRIDARVGAMAADTVTAAAVAADAVTEIQAGLATASVQTAIASAIAAVNADTDDIQARLPAALVGGRMNASIGSVADDAIGAAGVAADLITEIQNGLATAAGLSTLGTAIANVQTDTDDIQARAVDVQARLPAALVGGRMDASVGAMAANTVTTTALAQSAVDRVVDAVWDEGIGDHQNAGSTGEAMNAGGLTPTEVADAVWDATLASHADAGSTGAAVAAIGTSTSGLDTKLGSPAGASVSADIAAVSSKVGTPAGASLSADVAGVKTDTAAAISAVNANATKLADLEKVQLGRWKIQGTQLILYEGDNTTIFKTYNLLDDTGTPSNTRIFERVPV